MDDSLRVMARKDVGKQSAAGIIESDTTRSIYTKMVFHSEYCYATNFFDWNESIKGCALLVEFFFHTCTIYINCLLYFCSKGNFGISKIISL